MRSLFSFLIFVFVCIASAGCTRVPGLDESPLDVPLAPKGTKILVSDVVARVKCELYQATRLHLPSAISSGKTEKAVFDKKDPRLWFGKWDATVKLELVLSDSAGVAPGLTFNTPLVNGYNFTGGASSRLLSGGAVASPTVSSISQMFNFGLGGGASTEAIRTDDVQFTVSLNELVSEFETNKDPSVQAALYQNCAEISLPENSFLDANLGLKAWIDSALGPAEPRSLINNVGKRYASDDKFRYLKEGIHPAVSAGGAGGVSAPKTAKPSVQMQTVLEELHIGPLTEEEKVLARAKSLKAELDTHDGQLRTLQENFTKVVQPISRQVTSIQGICPQVELSIAKNFTTFQAEAVGAHDQAESILEKIIVKKDVKKPALSFLLDPNKDLDDVQNKYLVTLTEKIMAADDAASALYGAYQNCVASNVPPKPVISLDPPIDSLSHQVQFIVGTNANATPSWTFVRVKTGSAPLFSVSHSNTQTLTIVLASPNGSKASGSAETKLLGLGFQSDLNRLLVQ